MYCPVCGKQQLSNQTRFCSGCGFPLTGVSEVLAAGGASLRQAASIPGLPDSPRKRGIKQGAWIMLVGTFLVLPLFAIVLGTLRIAPFIIPIVAVLSFMGGLMRIVYSLMFESKYPAGEAVVDSSFAQAQISGAGRYGALPPQTSVPVSDFQMPRAGSWRETDDLEPSSVTDSTTKLLEKNQ